MTRRYIRKVGEQPLCHRHVLGCEGQSLGNSAAGSYQPANGHPILFTEPGFLQQSSKRRAVPVGTADRDEHWWAVNTIVEIGRRRKRNGSGLIHDRESIF